MDSIRNVRMQHMVKNKMTNEKEITLRTQKKIKRLVDNLEKLKKDVVEDAELVAEYKQIWDELRFIDDELCNVPMLIHNNTTITQRRGELHYRSDNLLKRIKKIQIKIKEDRKKILQ